MENSDFTRQVQTEDLVTQFLQDPYFGNGIGGTPVDGVLGRYSYHYEVQWLAFLMQFGIIGITGILTPLIALGMAFLRRPLTSAKLSFLGMYLLWLIAGFTNPFLISLTSGIVYGLFFITALRLRL